MGSGGILLGRALGNREFDARQEVGGRTVAVLTPELIKRPWELLLHANRGRTLHERLARDGGEGVVVIDVPWRAPRRGTDA